MFIRKVDLYTSYYNDKNKKKKAFTKQNAKNPPPTLRAFPSLHDSSVVILHDTPLLESPSPSLHMKFLHLVLSIAHFRSRWMRQFCYEEKIKLQIYES